jgi:hypothetical protein
LAGTLRAQNNYALKVPDGLAFSEFNGYESWHLVSISQDGPRFAAILANPAMIDAYQAGIPANGKPVPDGAKMAKIHWIPQKLETFSAATVPGTGPPTSPTSRRRGTTPSAAGCHTIVKTRDYVFTEYGSR